MNHEHVVIIYANMSLEVDLSFRMKDSEAVSTMSGNFSDMAKSAALMLPKGHLS